MEPTSYMITLFSDDEVIEETTGQGNTPRHALMTATLGVHPEAANQWTYEDDADGSGSLVCPDDDRLVYMANPVFDDDPLGEAIDACDGEIESNYWKAQFQHSKGREAKLQRQIQELQAKIRQLEHQLFG